MKFDDVQPGDILTPSVKLLERGVEAQYYSMWASRDSHEKACSQSWCITGPRHDYTLLHGQAVLVVKIKLNKTVRSYIEGFSLTHRCAVWFPISSYDDDMLKRIAKGQKSAKI